MMNPSAADATPPNLTLRSAELLFCISKYFLSAFNGNKATAVQPTATVVVILGIGSAITPASVAHGSLLAMTRASVVSAVISVPAVVFVIIVVTYVAGSDDTSYILLILTLSPMAPHTHAVVIVLHISFCSMSNFDSHGTTEYPTRGVQLKSYIVGVAGDVVVSNSITALIIVSHQSFEIHTTSGPTPPAAAATHCS